jgi:hypothetical protein
MPKLLREFPVVLGFRGTEADAQKLAMLAQKTCRGQGDVLRLLLRQAVLADGPDIQWQSAFPRSTSEADGSRTYEESSDTVRARCV